MTNDAEMVEQFRTGVPNQEADVEAFEMYNRAAGEQPPAFIQKNTHY